MMIEDPFATVEEAAVRPREELRSQIITAGRYRLPNRDGTPKSRGWQRVTNLVGAFSDQFGLRMWEIEQVMTAIAIGGESVLADLHRTMVRTAAMPKAEKRQEIEEFVSRCKDVAGGNEGTNFGRNRHSLVEADHLSLPTGAPDAFARQHRSLYRSALRRNQLSPVEGLAERRVLVEELEAVGTLDAILRDLTVSENLLFIGDLKTQKRFWTWLEIAAQLACYAHAVAMWEPSDPKDARAGRWVDMPPVSWDIGMVLWMPREHPSGEPAVDVYEVDIVAGWKTAKLAREVVIDRAGGKRVKEPRAWLRPAPPVTEVEKFAARFAAVDTREEGSRLVEEARRAGVWCDVLADEARIALDRLKKVR